MKNINYQLSIINYQFFLLLCLAPTLGCQTWRGILRIDAPRPAAFQISEGAGVQEIVSVVNANLGRVQSFKTDDASLSGSGMMGTLRGEIAFSRPGNFRLRGSTGITGAEIDVGRNQELSWFWMQRAEPKGVFYCRHEQVASCRFMERLPIDPSWMIDAMGFGLLESHLQYEGPFPVDKYHVSLRVEELSPNGQKRTREILINRLRGLPAAQRIFNHQDQLVLDASVRTYDTDPKTGITIPHTLEIRASGLNNDGKSTTIHINYGKYYLNTLDPSRSDLWKMPASTYRGYPPTDMTTL